MDGKPMVLTAITAGCAGCGDYRFYLYLYPKPLVNLTVVHCVIRVEKYFRYATEQLIFSVFFFLQHFHHNANLM
jgi:hypothetical protein